MGVVTLTDCANRVAGYFHCDWLKITHFANKHFTDKIFAEGGNIVKFASFSHAKVSGYTVNTAVGKVKTLFHSCFV